MSSAPDPTGRLRRADPPREPTVADVHKAGRPAARLIRDRGTVTFAYSPQYLDSGGPAVATSLPVTAEPLVTAAGAVPPFFAGLLPEGRRLSALRRAVKTSADDELSLLVEVGSDPVGDVQVIPQGRPPESVAPLIEVQRSFTEVTFSQALDRAGVVDRVALPGVQDKASAGMISVPADRAGRRYLLKVDPPEYPGVVLNEAFFITRARRAGLPVVAAEVVHDATGRPGLLVERFDRVPTGSRDGVRRLAVEDGAQALNIYPADKYAVPAEHVVSVLGALCPARVVALQALFAQVCFAWLTGNGDLHAKNLSVLATPDGEWRVAPAYDIPTTLPYRDFTFALTVQGKREGLSRRTLLAFADDVGLPAAAAVRTLDRLLAGTTDLADAVAATVDAGGLTFSREATKDLLRGLGNRRRAALPATR